MTLEKTKFAPVVLTAVLTVAFAGTLIVLTPPDMATRKTHSADAKQAVEVHAVKMSMPADSAPTQWTCPMHPQIVVDHAGNCPICGMTLVKLQPKKATPGVHIDVAQDVQERMGVTVTEVALHEFGAVLRVPAELVTDERRAVSLSPKVDGWVRKLGVSVVGQPVRKGQALYEIYSPDLQQRQRDYVDILTRRDALQAQAGGGMPSGNASPDLMLASVARERFRIRGQLSAADVPEQVLQDIDKTRHIHEVVPVLAEHDGVVTAISAREGAFVNPSQVVVSYADQATCWVELSLTPEQLGRLKGREMAEIRNPSDAMSIAHVLVDPGLAIMDPTTRTARVRVPLPANRSLLPGTLVSADIRLAPHQALTVNRDALIQTGDGNFVMVAEGGDSFTQVPVRVGASSADETEILSGLSAGQRVVTNGQFLLGAEASLQAARTRLSAAPMAAMAARTVAVPAARDL